MYSYVYKSITKSGLFATSYRLGGSIGTSGLSRHIGLQNELEADTLRQCWSLLLGDVASFTVLNSVPGWTVEGLQAYAGLSATVEDCAHSGPAKGGPLTLCFCVCCHGMSKSHLVPFLFLCFIIS